MWWGKGTRWRLTTRTDWLIYKSKERRPLLGKFDCTPQTSSSLWLVLVRCLNLKTFSFSSRIRFDESDETADLIAIQLDVAVLRSKFRFVWSTLLFGRKLWFFSASFGIATNSSWLNRQTGTDKDKRRLDFSSPSSSSALCSARWMDVCVCRCITDRREDYLSLNKSVVSNQWSERSRSN